VPTPVGHFKDPLHLTNASLRPPRAYVRCLRFPNARFDTHAAVARQSKGWQYRELDSGHHAVLTMPDAVANLLIELSS
jgi:hypothetical protein